MKAESIAIKHFDHTAWITKLKAYKNEISSLERRLAELAGMCTKPNEFTRIEHFQNQFILQRSNVNDILHAIKMDNREFEFEQRTSALSHVTSWSREFAFDRAETFERTMTELQSDFETFAEKFKRR